MTRRGIIHGLIAAALLIAEPATAAPDPVARGREIVTAKCAVCHAVGPTGDSPNPGAPRFRRLNARYDVEDLAEGLAEGLTVGHGPMPEWVFPPEDVAAIVAYLKSIQERDGTAEKVAAPPRR